LPLEDALACEEQPNLPGTIDEYPNWRIRYERDAAQMLDADDVRARLQPLEQRAER
jgi:4-alpha-glucanotransferase